MRKYPVEDYLVSETMTIRAALGQIEKTERRTVFVVDARRRLLGSVTDGDIRRWLLDGGDMSADLRQVTNPHPLSVRRRFDLQELRDELVERGATCAPVVDDQNLVIDIISSIGGGSIIARAGMVVGISLAAEIVIFRFNGAGDGYRGSAIWS